jgi:hypothetical protein
MKRCCFCKALRPEPARKAIKEGWKGVRVMEKGQKSHWTCPLHEKDQIHDHVELVADGLLLCESV